MADEIERLPNAREAARVADVTPHYLELAGRRAVVSNGYLFDSAASIGIVIPETLALVGPPYRDLRANEVLLDRQTAEILGARPGDHIDLDFVDPEGNHTLLSVILAGTYESTGHLTSSLTAIASPELLDVTSHGGTRYSSIYLTSDRPGDLRALIEERFGGIVQVFDRVSQIREAEARASVVGEPGRELFIAILAALVVAVIVHRDVAAGLAIRQQRMAVLLAMGVHPDRITWAVVLEEAGVLAGSLVAGAAVGYALFKIGTGLSVSGVDVVTVLGEFALIIGASSIAAILTTRRRLSRLPINRLLFETSP
ncbi:MAG TPA: hypothetical protein VNO86_02215 [Candidatus Binatia bacterium]|nr:hypothetical protein [Candidatus Binatia bacterium]